MDFRIVHEIPGRVRLRAPRGFDEGFGAHLASVVEAVEGVTGCRCTPRTGSLLFNHAGASSRAAALRAVAEASAGSAPCTGDAEIHHRRHHPSCQRDAAQRTRRQQTRRAGRAQGAPRQACDARHVCVPSGQGPFAVAGQGMGHGPGMGLGRLLRYLLLRPLLPAPVRMATALLRATPVITQGLRSLARGRLSVDVLDAAAIGVSLLRRDFRSVGTITFLLAVGEALEAWTRKASREGLAASLALDVDTIWVRRGEAEVQVPLASLADGDVVVVRAGGAIPVDGVVVDGEALVNQASMTGEPLGVMRVAGAAVFAGTVVEEGTLGIRATGVGHETRLSRIVDFIERSEALKAGIQGKAERLADAVVPFSFALAASVWLLTRDPARAASVLLVDYSCAIRLATPLAILSAMREGASRGVLVKGGRFLEGLAAADAVVFDKTGTLTEARPRVTAVVPAEGFERDDVLRIAACLEEHFPHPVARAVVHKAEEENLQHHEEHAEVEYVVAHGIASRLHGERVLVGSHHFVHEDEGVPVSTMDEAVATLSAQGHSVLYLAIGGRLAGVLGIEDPLRPEAPAVVTALRQSGVRRILMLTGDGERTAAAVAARLGIDEYRAQVLPADKAFVVQELKAQGHTVIMVGDGINDAPALSSADVGVTLRDGTDLAREVADVVLLHCDLTDLAVARELGRRTLARIRHGFISTMTLNTLFLAAGLAGLARPGIAAVLHNLTTVGVALNAMRPLLPAMERAGGDTA